MVLRTYKKNHREGWDDNNKMDSDEVYTPHEILMA